MSPRQDLVRLVGPGVALLSALPQAWSEVLPTSTCLGLPLLLAPACLHLLVDGGHRAGGFLSVCLGLFNCELDNPLKTPRAIAIHSQSKKETLESPKENP